MPDIEPARCMARFRRGSPFLMTPPSSARRLEVCHFFQTRPTRIAGGPIRSRTLQTIPEHSAFPTGDFALATEPWEALNSQWVHVPRVMDRRNGEVLWSPTDSHWSLDRATWRSPIVVELELRKFPGKHRPPAVCAILDCSAKTAQIGEIVCPLADLERMLDVVLDGRPRG